jgi:hypothetical protein
LKADLQMLYFRHLICQTASVSANAIRILIKSDSINRRVQCFYTVHGHFIYVFCFEVIEHCQVRAIDEAVSRWLPTAAARVCARVWQGVLLTVLDLVTEMKRKVSWRRPRPKIGL